MLYSLLTISPRPTPERTWISELVVVGTIELSVFVSILASELLLLLISPPPPVESAVPRGSVVAVLLLSQEKLLLTISPLPSVVTPVRTGTAVGFVVVRLGGGGERAVPSGNGISVSGSGISGSCRRILLLSARRRWPG